MPERSAELFQGTPDEITPAERELEDKIAEAAMRLATASTWQGRRHWFAELRRLHGERQAHTVARLERKRGLRS